MTKTMTYTPQEKKFRRQQRIAWLLAFIVPLSLFWTCWEWNSHEPPLFSLDPEDTEVDMEMMPDLKEDKEMMAAPAPELKQNDKKAVNINKVDEIETEMDAAPDLAQALKFMPIESDLADIEDENVEDVPPISMNPNGELPERVLEEYPKFPGGYGEFVEWITRNINYPAAAYQANQKGYAKATFIVEPDGSISNLKIIESAAYALDSELLRVLRRMPKWTPATYKGKPVRSMVCVPVDFAM